MADQCAHIQTRRGDNVRIGPVSLITLIAVICMAVLAVLTTSTSNANAAISERQANAYQLLYTSEQAGQEFVAGVDGVLAGVRAAGGNATDGARAVDAKLDAICEAARNVDDGDITCTAAVDGVKVVAEFTCADTRHLSIALTIRKDATYRIDEWRMSSAQQGSQSAGTLWSGA